MEISSVKRQKRKSNVRDKHYHMLTPELRQLSRMLKGDRKLFPMPKFTVLEE